MRKLIAYMCLTIFSFQILPVKEIGSILFKGLITEEEVAGHGGCDHPPAKLKKDGDPLHLNPFVQESLRVEQLTHDVQVAVHETENLPSHFVADILTPPPNC